MDLLKPFCPNGSIPPPMKLKKEHCESTESLKFSPDRDNMSVSSVPFVPLAYRAHFPAAATTPFDAFCPLMKEKLPDCICDVCGTSFPSHAQMLVHRRELHKYVRYKEFDISEVITVFLNGTFDIDFGYFFVYVRWRMISGWRK